MPVIHDPSHPTGIDDGGDKALVEITRARDRKANAALQLKVEFHNWDEIAEIVGYPDGYAAQVAVERALEKNLNDPETREAMRGLASERLQHLLKSVWRKATDDDHPEHLPSNKRASELIAQWTKLHGADAPAEITIHNPTEREISEWVAEATKGKIPQVEESDIFDVDVIEDDMKEIEA